MSNIILLKLITGEEVIGKEVEKRDSVIILSDVRVLALQPAGNGQIGIALMPFFAGAHENNVRIYDAHILARPEGDLPKQIEDMYLQQTSGLDLSSSAANVSQFDPNARK